MRWRLAVTDSHRSLFPCLRCCTLASPPGFCPQTHVVIKSSNIRALTPPPHHLLPVAWLNSRSTGAFVLCDCGRNDQTRTSEPSTKYFCDPSSTSCFLPLWCCWRPKALISLFAWAGQVADVGQRRGGTMAGGGEVVQELHVGRSWCQLQGRAGECLELQTLTEYFPAPPPPHPHAHGNH